MIAQHPHGALAGPVCCSTGATDTCVVRQQCGRGRGTSWHPRDAAGVTADGGLIDFRFQVVDAHKAATMPEPGNLPVLIAEDRRIALKLRPRADVAHLQAGRVYYLLYPNAQSAINPGSRVTLVIGDLRLEHLIAQ